MAMLVIKRTCIDIVPKIILGLICSMEYILNVNKANPQQTSCEGNDIITQFAETASNRIKTPPY